MLPLRTRIFIVISLAVLVILGITVGLLVARRKAAPTTAPADGNTVDSTNFDGSALSAPAGTVPNVQGLTVAPLSAEEAQKKGVANLATTFVERYFSYTSDSQFANVRDVQEIVTPGFWKVISGRTAGSGGVFVSVMVEAVGKNISSWKETSAVVRVEARKTTGQDGLAPAVKNEVYLVTVLKQGNNWLVDNVQSE